MRLILNIIFSGAIIVFGLLIHNNASFHLMVSISDEYKYKRLVKTTFKSCGKPMFFEIYHSAIALSGLPTCLHYSSKIPICSGVQPVLPTSIDRMGYYLGPIVEFL